MVATIDRLKPKTVYSFSIKVEIPADNNYNLTEGPPSTCRIQTNIWHPGYGEICELANSPCEPGTSCVETHRKLYRCLCNDTQYWNKNRICVPLKGLKVTEVHVTKVTSTSVLLSWSNRNVDKLTAVYSVSYRNKSLAAPPGGMNITNLQPARNYSFEIFVIIPSELNYKEKRGPGVSISVQTIDETSRPVPESTTLVPLISRGSELTQTKTVLTTTASELGEFKLNDSNSISLILFLLVTVSLSLLLVISIVINIILMYKRRKRQTRNRQNVYHTTNESHQETHQYLDTTHLNQSHYDEVTELALKHYTN
uniref:Fibronectin type-III domain-containing protein n=1 Tax=Biomphalaria glabrata TaxID=6526 RepID=A0A2C9JK66_BIOGL